MTEEEVRNETEYVRGWVLPKDASPSDYGRISHLLEALRWVLEEDK